MFEIVETGKGFYLASRASIPERSAQWRHLRDEKGWNIISTWIDEAGAGETACFGELWSRIKGEISGASCLLLYVEPDDFPLKGALVEVGLAMGEGIPIYVAAPGITLEGLTMRPLGSWVIHPTVTVFQSLDDALEAAAKHPGVRKVI